MGQAAVPLAITALSTGAQWWNNQQALKRQDRAAARGIEQQARHQREATARLNQQLGGLEQSDPDAERRAASDQFVSQLRRTRGEAAASMPAVPGASDRYVADVAENEAGSASQAERIADLMSRIDAPMHQRRGERESAARTGTALDQIGNFSQGDDFLTRLRVRSQQPNPWVDLAAKAGQTYAGWLAGQPGAAAGGSVDYVKKPATAKRLLG